MSTVLSLPPVASQGEPASPCIGVCKLDPVTQLCEGCFRTLEEIAGWGQATPAQKRAVLALVEERHQRWLESLLFI